ESGHRIRSRQPPASQHQQNRREIRGESRGQGLVCNEARLARLAVLERRRSDVRRSQARRPRPLDLPEVGDAKADRPRIEMLPLVSRQRLCQALRLTGDPNDGHPAWAKPPSRTLVSVGPPSGAFLPAPIAPHRSCRAGNPRDARSYSTCYRSILKPTLMVTWNSCTAPSTMRPRSSTTSNQSMWRMVFEASAIPDLTASAKLMGEVPTNSTILWVPAILFPLSMEVSV